jgi:hypothetical protein
MYYDKTTPFEQWMRDNIYGKLAPSTEIKELMAFAFEGGQKALEQPAQKPIFWMHEIENIPFDGHQVTVAPEQDDYYTIPIYAHPAPAQEPVAWVRTKNGEIDWGDDCLGSDKDSLIESACDPENKFNEYDAIPLYTHPHQWQSLKDDEIKEIWLKLPQFPNHFDISRAIEQALKEKNYAL